MSHEQIKSSNIIQTHSDINNLKNCTTDNNRELTTTALKNNPRQPRDQTTGPRDKGILIPVTRNEQYIYFNYRETVLTTESSKNKSHSFAGS